MGKPPGVPILNASTAKFIFISIVLYRDNMKIMAGPPGPTANFHGDSFIDGEIKATERRKREAGEYEAVSDGT